MSILIKGMEMPNKCIECRLMRRCGKDDLDFVCMPARIYVEDLTNAYKPRPDYCPLVPVPNHGRSIDGDALFDFILNIYKTAQGDARKAYRDVLDTIVAAGDVIPAEEETE